MVAGMSLIPLGDAFNKAAAQSSGHAAVTLAWFRVAIGAAIVTPLALGLAGSWRPSRGFLVWIGVRGALFVAGITSITQALMTVPLADTFGAFFIAPFVSLAVARLALSERVRRVDWAAVALGFAGVLLVVRPGFGVAPGIGWALLAGFFYGCYITATRAAALSGRPLSQLSGQLLVGLALLTPFALLDPVSLAPQVPGLLAGSGLSSALGNLLAILALGMGSTALLAPLIYSQLAVAAALSVLVFGTPVPPVAALGMVLIVLAGLSRVILRS